MKGLKIFRRDLFLIKMLKGCIGQGDMKVVASKYENALKKFLKFYRSHRPSLHQPLISPEYKDD